MANKSVIDIDVNDEQFRDFYKLFIGFTRNLEKNAQRWEDLNVEIEKSGVILKDILAPTKEINSELRKTKAAFKKLVEETGQIGSNTKKTNKGMKAFFNFAKKTWKVSKKIAISFKNTAKSIYKMGKGLTAFGLIGASLSGIATLWGLRELANSAVSRQRTARGLGDTPGRVTAFKTDYGRYVNPDMLNTISSSQGNLTGRMWLSRSTGKSINDIQGMRPTQIAQLAIMSAKRWWDSTPVSIRTQEYARTKGFQEAGISWQDLRRIGATSMLALKAAGSQFRADSSAFGFSDRSAGQWYNLSRQFSVAGNTIESSLTRKLAGLATPLSGLIKSVTDDFNALVNSELTPENIKSFGDAFHDVSKFIGSKEFISGIKHFGEVVGEAASMIVSFMRVFGYGKSNTVPSAQPASLAYQLKAMSTDLTSAPGTPRLSMQQAYANEGRRLNSFLYPNETNVTITNGTGGDISTSINGLGY